MFNNLEIVLLGLIAGMVILIILCWALWFRTGSLKRRCSRLLGGKDRLNLDDLLNHLNHIITAEQQKSETLGSRLKDLEARVSKIVGIGLVRYNAFQDTGGDLSFSLALINNGGDGVVITSIFGRDENRLYGKPIKQGGSRHPLSQEEQVALQKAREAVQG